MKRSVLPSLFSLLISLFAAPEIRAQDDLLPDIIVRESDLQDYDVVTDGNEVLLRLTTATPNIGKGPLHIVGVFPTNPDGSQNVDQRIFRTDGSFHDEPAGLYDFHSGHNHVHLAGWAVYRLREVRSDNGQPGAIIAESEKTSFCLLDSAIHDPDLPGFPSERVYRSCGETFQGISVGWVDIYGKELIGQNIDIKGLAQGTYWLEAIADPDNHIIEERDDNNAAQILVTIGDPTVVEGPLEVPPTDLHGDDHHLPDLRIGPGPNPDSHIGNDVYEPNGDGGHDHGAHDHGAMVQILHLRSGKARKLNFYSSLQNESSNRNSYIVQCTGAKKKKMKVSHFITTGGTSSNVTAAVKSAGLLVDMKSDELMTFCSEAALTRKAKKRLRVRKKKKIRGTLGFKAWNAAVRDEAWIYLQYP